MLRPLVCVLLVLSLAGCGSSPAEREVQSSVSASTVAETLKTKLREQVGVEPSAVDCPDSGLPSRRGAQITCELVAPNGDRYDVVVTAATVDDATQGVTFDFKVSDTRK